jgi:small subunit ribosomal protein S13
MSAVKEYKNVFVRISGINIPSKKKIFVGLPLVYGVGKYRADQICKELSVNPQARMGDLDDSELNKIRKYIEENYVVEGDLRSEVSSNIKTLIAIGCYKGMRHRKNLPVHGQRTKTNAKTRKKRKA